MEFERRTLDLVGQVYDTVADWTQWRRVAETLSDMLGGPAVSMAMRPSSAGHGFDVYRHGIDESFTPVFLDQMSRGFPWIDRFDIAELHHRFVRIGDYFGPEEMEDTDFYRKYLEPQGLSSDPPIVHILSPTDDMLASAILIYRSKGGREIVDQEIAWLDQLIPHFARALHLYGSLRGSKHQAVALHEVMDRMPTGVILLDSDRLPVLMNRLAHQLIDSKDGFKLAADGPRAASSTENKRLRSLLDSACEPELGASMTGGGLTAISRPSGRRPYPVMVAPLIPTGTETVRSDAACILFISDPDWRKITTVDMLKTLYGLTNAEAELVQLLLQGHSLEESAASRGVTMNTARSQLKQIFAKTDTRRQGELLRLVLAGVGSVSEN